MPVGPWELVLLLVIVLVIFGPGKLPDIGSAVGKGIREFRKASTELESAVRGEPQRSTPPEEKSGQQEGGGGTKH